MMLCMTLLWSCTTSVARIEFTVNGHEVFYDSRTGTYLCSMAEETFDDSIGEMKVAVSYDAASYRSFTLNGNLLTAGDSCVLTNVGENATFALSVESSDGKRIEGKLSFTFLPILHLDGKFGNKYTAGNIKLATADESNTYQAKIKWRGGNTNTFNKHKRNYKIKLLGEDEKKLKVSMLGMREDNVWILDAAQMDKSRMRNRVATDLWLDMAHAPYHVDSMAQARTGVQGKPVELFLGDEYMGIYYLTEAMNERQLGLKKYDKKNDAVRGQLWKSHHYTRATAFFELKNDNYSNNSVTWEGFETKYPKLDSDQRIDYATLRDAIAFACRSSEEEFNTHVEEYFDVPVLIDYIIFLQVLKAGDNENNNTYWFCPDCTRDKRLSLAVWDLDATMGVLPEPSNTNKDQLIADSPFSLHNGAFAGLLKHSSPRRDLVKQRYDELRHTWLSTENLVARYRAYLLTYKKCGAMQREQRRWSHDSDIEGDNLNMQAEVDYIAQWVDVRMKFLDAHMMELIIDL